MEIRLALALPRDEISVPLVRRVLKQSMDVLGVEPDITHDIELALTEACTNVLEHAAAGEEYEMSIGIHGDRFVLEVADRGAGFEGDAQGRQPADAQAEGGRGIQLMRALVDKLEFTNRPPSGTVVHLEKTLRGVPGSLIERWIESDRSADVRR